jgi:CRP-like cAMP-binding protein
MRLVNVSKVYEAKFGECVVREGESGDNFYIILSGEVEVSSQGMLIAKLSRGGHFGEMALIDDMARSATVTVTKDADLLCISAATSPICSNASPSCQRRAAQHLADDERAASRNDPRPTESRGAS